MLDYEMMLTDAEEHYNTSMKELGKSEFIPDEVCCVRVGIGGGVVNTNDLRVMKFKEAMKSGNMTQWQIAVDEEHGRMTKHNVWQAILCKDLPVAAKILTYMWAMKLKANSTYRA
jgi:hypothetical protein